MWGPVVLTHQDSGEGKFTRDEEGACVLWSPPNHPTTLRTPCLLRGQTVLDGFGLGWVGWGGGAWEGGHYREGRRASVWRIKALWGELCLRQDREWLSHTGRCGGSDSG